ncbi:MBL fold metallo-hydrolase [Bacillus massilinigeriensis]|uniref:MBL fold metallo-hydrolase n=1 Tax=Bacillus mediterraneensis TaxID=1805474 RepID=UPI0008F80427|nr:MBL fold metallo-hydrolase [Bacillus mediterraneensis]
MKWSQLPLGPLQTNCYIIFAPNKECLVIDPGEEAGKIFTFLEDKELTPIAILLTHAHFDHIGAVDELREKYGIPVYLHEKEAKWLFDPSLNGSQFFMMGSLVRIKPADYIIAEEKEMEIGQFKFMIKETPGHSPGSVSFYFPDSDFVVSGDTLFSKSIGRSDLPGGNHQMLLQSIHEKLLVLDEITAVLPGHGPTTTILEEVDRNPYLNGF